MAEDVSSSQLKPSQACNMKNMKRIKVIDSHTGGEPTRLVVDGFPDLGGGGMAERRELLARQYDDWRAAAVLEPRGSDVVVGALLCKPVDPSSAAGVIFFNNTGYLGMCGHGTIGRRLARLPGPDSARCAPH
jgi:4-hydroxyproline epimerase